MMKIETEFTKFLSEINISYVKDWGEITNIELKLFSVDELKWIGFFNQKIDEFIKSISPLKENDINEFFSKHIENLIPDFMEGYLFEFNGATIGELIKKLKLAIIKNYLSFKLYNYVNELKSPFCGF
ncbi:MAG: hypothetical protein N2490_07615 [Ignavibacteria bacterium]|nr:hypothetical protein [Ignavibacteria bacterium]